MTFVDRMHFTFLFILIGAVTLFAQDSYNIQFNYAKKLFGEEKYFDAITEFKRLLFFDESNTYNYEANFFIGLSYKGGAKFSDALQHFTLAELNSRTEAEFY